MAHELQALDKFIWQKLTGDATLVALVGTYGTPPTTAPKVFADTALQSVAPPYVLFTFNSSEDITSLGKPRIRHIVRPLYLIRVVTKGDDYALAGQVADRIDAVMHGATGTVATPTALVVQSTGREQLIRYQEAPGGVRHNHVGGLYRFFVSFP